MIRAVRIELDAPTVLRRITRWIGIEARVARDARHLKALPDDRLADIGIGRDGILRALRRGRAADPGSMTRRCGGISLHSPILSPWTYP
jgi:uncharacterized protein YjiS (DUF1127 family)